MEDKVAGQQDPNQAFIHSESESEFELDATATLLEKWEEKLCPNPDAVLKIQPNFSDIFRDFKDFSHLKNSQCF